MAAFAALAAGFFVSATATDAFAASHDTKVKQLLKAKSCGACHYIPGVAGATGTIGPSLKGLKNRGRIAGGKLENTEENLRAWLRNPKSIRSDTMMPNLGLEDDEIEMLLKFFAKL